MKFECYACLRTITNIKKAIYIIIWVICSNRINDPFITFHSNSSNLFPLLRSSTIEQEARIFFAICNGWMQWVFAHFLAFRLNNIERSRRIMHPLDLKLYGIVTFSLNAIISCSWTLHLGRLVIMCLQQLIVFLALVRFQCSHRQVSPNGSRIRRTTLSSWHVLDHFRQVLSTTNNRFHIRLL